MQGSDYVDHDCKLQNIFFFSAPVSLSCLKPQSSLTHQVFNFYLKGKKLFSLFYNGLLFDLHNFKHEYCNFKAILFVIISQHLAAQFFLT